jgi:Ca-activated chloride channel family protein
MVAFIACGLLGLIHLSAGAGQVSIPVFKSDVRLIEVYATVTDHSGKYVKGLIRDQFEVREEGELQQISLFEPTSSELWCAILLDATGSMQTSLPTVKDATLRLIDNLRDTDSFAVYTFNSSLALIQDFTQDRHVAKRAVLGVRAGGATALFDAIAQIAAELSAHKGKKSIIVFTDGGENASLLQAEAAMARARSSGTPIYTVAQGDALKSQALLFQLKLIASWTGAASHVVRKSRDIDAIFQKMTEDLQNTYLLAYSPAASLDSKWRSIRVSVKGMLDVRVRAREGYSPTR